MTDNGRPFATRGINHLALVSSDMVRTVDFYQGKLGFPLIKTVAIPGGGQHFFFDIGGGNALAFFWFADAPAAAPGIAAPAALPGVGDIASAVGSMNHVAIDVDPDDIDDFRQRLVDLGIDASPVMNHDDSEWGVSRKMHPGVFVRSVYFSDPDGVCLEFAAWTRPLGPDDVRHQPVDATGRVPAGSSASAVDPVGA